MGSLFKSRLAGNFASRTAPSVISTRRPGRSVLKRRFLIPMLLLLAITSGHAEQRKRLPTERLEKYEDPPMYIFRLGASAQMVSQFGAFTSYQINVDVDGNNITGDA